MSEKNKMSHSPRICTSRRTYPESACRLVLGLVDEIVEVWHEVAVQRPIAAPPADVRPTATLPGDRVTHVVERTAHVTVARLAAIDFAGLQTPVLVLHTTRHSTSQHVTVARLAAIDLAGL